MSILLLGYRGSGKTTIGRRLADRLWQPFVDTDQMIVQSTGLPIRDIFQQFGEDRFRELETAAIAEALLKADSVIALGGGAVVREENRARIIASGHKRIYLRCDPQVLLQRIKSDAATALTRPSLTPLGGGIDEIRALLREREPLYQQVMTAELDVTNLSVDDAVHWITRLV
jgi:shikimate kinase